MPKIKYIGTADNFSELAYTGKQSIWKDGQSEFRSDAEAAQLAASGMFEFEAVPLMGRPNPVTGGIAGSVGGAGVSLERAALITSGSSAAIASANTAAIQAAVDAVGPGGNVVVPGGFGVVEINGTIFHDNIIEVKAGTTLKLRSGSTCSMFRNRAWNATRSAVTGMTAVGQTATIDMTGVSAPTQALFAVGGYVSIIGFTNSGFNGVHPITAKAANSLTVLLPRTPIAGTATGTGTVAVPDNLVGIVGQGALDYNDLGQTNNGSQDNMTCLYINVVRVMALTLQELFLIRLTSKVSASKPRKRKCPSSPTTPRQQPSAPA